MLRIELKPSHSGQPGYGELTVHDWPNGDSGLELTVQRNQDGRYLGAAGDWGSNPVWHGLDGLSLNGDSLSGEVGPWLIDPLMQDPQMAYMLQIRDADGGDKGVLRILGTLLSSLAAGNSSHDEQKIHRSNTPPPVAPVPEPEPEPEPEELTLTLDDEPQLGDLNANDRHTEVESLSAEPREPAPVAAAPAPAKKSSKLWLIPVLLLLLAAIGAALWWFVLRAPGTSTPAVSSTSSGEAAVCSAEALGQVSDDLVYIQSCLKSNPSSEQVLSVIAAAKEAKRCGVVQRLYAHKAQSGDAAVAFAYAREYDPESFTSGGCISAADAETAAYWYEIAVTNDPANQQASQRLEALRK
ncbi:hypothetical protein [Pseudomonas sp. 5P_3.1_Bac2]|uniref:hypothetical protein n=1 Tax=Pseudomonas sp. 5P_3.1_Bac2 TaxID=2971617 RepID=UPI0021C7A87C|nr:hypothetical protein [Pseudomonas sp. 5P_3.1_Bac2]MCU1719270.1 hypothetical protein [Pseudomonas sp. 5P_3.1_Bac2]